MHSSEFLEKYCAQLVGSLNNNLFISEYTKNTAVIGAYAEATISEMVQKFVNPYLCSTGSVISNKLLGQELKQLDLIIWDPTPLPPIFENSGFALVPTHSVHGVLEIKRSAYSDVGSKMLETLDWAEKQIEGSRELKPEVYAYLSKGGDPSVFVGGVDNDILDVDPFYIAMGVICLRKHDQKDKVLDSLIGAGRVVVLQEINEKGEIRINTSHVLHLLDFLKTVRLRVKNVLPKHGFNINDIATRLGEKAPGPLRRASK